MYKFIRCLITGHEWVSIKSFDLSNSNGSVYGLSVVRYCKKCTKIKKQTIYH